MEHAGRAAHLKTELEQGQRPARKVAQHLRDAEAAGAPAFSIKEDLRAHHAFRHKPLHNHSGLAASVHAHYWQDRRSALCQDSSCSCAQAQFICSSSYGYMYSSSGPHLRHIFGQRHRNLDHAEVVQEPARQGARLCTGGLEGAGSSGGDSCGLP